MKFLIKNKESCGHNINRIQVYKLNSEKFNFFMGVQQILLRKEFFKAQKTKNNPNLILDMELLFPIILPTDKK